MYCTRLKSMFARVFPSIKKLGSADFIPTPIDDAHNATIQETILSAQRAEIDSLRKSIYQLDRTLKTLLLQQRTLLTRDMSSQTTIVSPKVSPDIQPLEKIHAKLAELHPRLHPIWRSLLQVNETEYIDRPTGSCSLDGHAEAALFRAFIHPYLRGRVLDIGCGNHPVPSYLEGYPTELICGLDPLPPISGHPFEFAQGFAEFLPWADQYFNTIIAATSLDHVLSLKKTCEEICRTLKDDGLALFWIGFCPGAKPYQPDDPTLEPIDRFHLFHFDRPWFLEFMATYFDVVEEFPLNWEGHFYALKKKGRVL